MVLLCVCLLSSLLMSACVITGIILSTCILLQILHSQDVSSRIVVTMMLQIESSPSLYSSVVWKCACMSKKNMQVSMRGTTLWLGCVLLLSAEELQHSFCDSHWLLNSIWLSREPPPNLSHIFRELCWVTWGGAYSQLPLGLKKTHKSHAHRDTRTHKYWDPVSGQGPLLSP